MRMLREYFKRRPVGMITGFVLLVIMLCNTISYALFRDPHCATHALLAFIAINTLDLDPFKEERGKG